MTAPATPAQVAKIKRLAEAEEYTGWDFHSAILSLIVLIEAQACEIEEIKARAQFAEQDHTRFKVNASATLERAELRIVALEAGLRPLVALWHECCLDPSDDSDLTPRLLPAMRRAADLFADPVQAGGTA